MPQTMLLVGTRKGCFVLEGDGDRARLEGAGPVLRGWPVYHAVHDPDSGAIYAAAASEWHGAGVWRSTTSARRGSSPARASRYGDDGPKLSKVSTLDGRARPRARGRRGAGHLREPRRRRDVVAAHDARRPAGQRGLGRSGEAAAGPSRAPAIIRRRRPGALLGHRAGDRHVRDDRRRQVVDAAEPRACAPTGRASTTRSASACTGS